MARSPSQPPSPVVQYWPYAFSAHQLNLALLETENEHAPIKAGMQLVDAAYVFFMGKRATGRVATLTEALEAVENIHGHTEAVRLARACPTRW